MHQKLQMAELLALGQLSEYKTVRSAKLSGVRLVEFYCIWE
jgi:hypothetical protein